MTSRADTSSDPVDPASAAGSTQTGQSYGSGAESTLFPDFMSYMQALYRPQGDDDEGPETSTGEAWDARAWGIDQPPEDSRFGTEVDDVWGYQGGLPPGQPAPRRRVPQYSTESARFILNGMSAGELEGLEREFVRAGYQGFSEDDIVSADRSSLASAFSALVVSADMNRISWEDQLGRDVDTYQTWLSENPDEGEKSWRELNPFVAPSYLKPDYATLSQSAKYAVRAGLGRTPTSSEMKILTDFMGDVHHDEWRSNEYDLARSNWERTARAYETGEEQGPDTIQAVDSDARFAQFFEDRFDNELAHRQRVQQVSENEGNLFGSLNTISRMMG
ncbi:MAG: hypothetical protein ABFR89_02535 [Actinomycetota bacterium]